MSRDYYSGARNDKRRMRNTAREAEQRDQEKQFRAMDMLQKPTANGATSAIKAELADLNARIAIIEAELAQGIEASPAKADKFARLIASVAVIMAATWLIVEVLRMVAK